MIVLDLNVRTESWLTKEGLVVKAVVRDSKGRILGTTNQTDSVVVIKRRNRK